MQRYLALLFAVLGSPGFVVTEHYVAPFVVDTQGVQFVVTDRVRKPTSKALPTVVCISASWCAPCKAVKADQQAGKFPFPMVFVDIDREYPPVAAESLPWFYWKNVDGKAYQYPRPGTRLEDAGYPGPERLAQIVRSTQPKGS